MPLVDDVRREVAVRHDPRAALERRSDHGAYQLRPRGHVEEHLRRRCQRNLLTVEKDLSDGVAGGRGPGVAAGHHSVAAAPEPLHQRCHLR